MIFRDGFADYHRILISGSVPFSFRKIFRNSVAKKLFLCFYANDSCIRWLHAMNLRLDEACIVEHCLQFFWRIGRHAFHNVCPHGITINNLHHDGELTTGFQYTTHFLQAVGKVGPKIHRFDSRYEVELPVFVGQFLG